MGELSNHIELPVLCDFVCGSANMDPDTINHIEICEDCRCDLGWLRRLDAFGVRDRQYEPPASALVNAEKAFKLNKPGLVTIAREIVANLVYDSFNEPMPLGVRQRDLPARQVLYQADCVHLDLMIEAADESGLIIGQIVVDRADMEITGLQIEITQNGQVIGKSSTNGLGEFVFQDLPKGNYELQVLVSDTMVKLPPFPLSH